jgi:hypothetical protein
MSNLNEEPIQESVERLLLLVKLDSEHLCERIEDHFIDYMSTFALKRTRVHFADIFKNRYCNLKIGELQKFSEELIIALDNYYTEVDRLCWYLNHTEDMPATAEEQAQKRVKLIKGHYSTLRLYIEAELENRQEINTASL